MSRIPPFEDAFLETMAESFRKRMKALRHKAGEVTGDKTYDTDGDTKQERFEVFLRVGYQTTCPTLRLHVWPSRWVWVDAREFSKQGWVWEWRYEGRLLGETTERDVVAAFEKTLESLSQMNSTRVSDLTAIWKPLLARGPVAIG